MNLRCLTLILAAFFFGDILQSSPAASSPDWPQWQGPKRDNISKETGLLQEWPKDGPAKTWAITGLGEGYGSVAIKGDRIYIQGTKAGNSVVFCLNRADGKPVWDRTIGPRLDQDQGAGPRSTPTVGKNFLWVLDEGGNLACLKPSDGSIVWKRNMLDDFKGANPYWHISESPLIDGEKVIVTPGGPDACVVALNKKTGETIWTSKGQSDPAHYCSCVIAEIDGIRAYTTFTAKAGIGVRARDGAPMWSYPGAANETANITTPVVSGNKVFYSSNYGQGCGLIELKKEGDLLKEKEIYFNKELQNHHGGIVLIGDHIYGYSGDILTCIEFATGKEVWKDRAVGKGAVTYADGQLYILSEANVVGLADATPKGYKEKGQFRIDDTGRSSWAHPVVCGGHLYIRNQDYLNCYDISSKENKAAVGSK